jgi:nicotinamidase/pyrazinamidase
MANDTMKSKKENKPQLGDALVLIDIQNDFLPGGNLAVPNGDQIIPIINDYITLFKQKGLPIFATRDWHPINHISFINHGGIWPSHCVAGTEGAAFPDTLHLSDEIVVISKATSPEMEAYSGLEGTDLDRRLKTLNVKRVWIAGLATDYCVINTVLDLIASEYRINLLIDGIRAVNVNPEDGRNAEREMISLGARPVTRNDIL